MEPILELANRWLQLDQDETTRREIETLIQQDDTNDLERRLRTRIAFGTAGLRASMKAGFAHMNGLTVLQASQGLAQYVRAQHEDDPGNSETGAELRPLQNTRLSIVVGYDARHNSEKFARLAAAAFLAKGFRVLWFGRCVHTPLVPFAVKRHAAAAGVMVTASHNPKNDNGYKVYWANGSQIIPPHDAGIARAIDDVHFILTWDTTQVDHNALVENVYDETSQAYFDALVELVAGAPVEGEPLPFTYTPMHGVGLPFMTAATRALGLPQEVMKVVTAQGQPDPDFPTVPFPNPEEKGALDLAIQEAEKNGTKLILANDPDADRFAVAERIEPDGRWHQFSGNQMGVLLASHIFETFLGHKSQLALLSSTVSSRMLAAMAVKEGFHFRETLTGFKWLGNVAQQLEHGESGLQAVYAYEEAIGYMFSQVVWDKDGVAAATVFLTACRRWAAQGYTPWGMLQQLYQRYGYFEDANTYLISPSPAITDRVFADIRASQNGSRPERVGARRIQRWRDLTLGYDSASADHTPDLPIDATAQMITCELDEDVVFTARGSGTEPKIKLYIEAKAESSAQAKTVARVVLDDLLQEWFRPEYGLNLAGT